uniref:Uncharacterized protein n=1 Tax=Triticum urartu TaxID=4572 RepID=A0A8R7TPZ6_TRIUA
MILEVIVQTFTQLCASHSQSESISHKTFCPLLLYLINTIHPSLLFHLASHNIKSIFKCFSVFVFKHTSTEIFEKR